jgi:hypothetical protein
MKWLTRQEQYVLTVALALLLVGLAVKTYRTAHPPGQLETTATAGATNTAAVAN